MKTNELELDSVRKSVREHYGKVAARGGGCILGPGSILTLVNRFASSDERKRCQKAISWGDK